MFTVKITVLLLFSTYVFYVLDYISFLCPILSLLPAGSHSLSQEPLSSFKSCVYIYVYIHIFEYSDLVSTCKMKCNIYLYESGLFWVAWWFPVLPCSCRCQDLIPYNWTNLNCVQIHFFFFHLSLDGHNNRLHNLALVSSTTIIMHVQVSLSYADWYPCEYIPNSDIVVSYGSSSSSFSGISFFSCKIIISFLFLY